MKYFLIMFPDGCPRTAEAHANASEAVAPSGTLQVVTTPSSHLSRQSDWCCSPASPRLGDVGYNLLLRINVVVNKVRSLLGYDYWSFSKWVKDSVKQAVSYVGDFEATVASVCNQRGYAGIICGHIHKAANREVGGVRYLNCGDWVESCTAILHTHDGQFQVIEHGAKEKANAADFQADAMADNATSDLPQKEIA